MILLQFIYFVLIGWWAGALAAVVGYLLCLSIIGLPFGVLLMDRLPTLIFLHPKGTACPEGYEHRHRQEDLPLLLRAVWFIFIGWELGFLAVCVGYLLTITLIGMPFGIWVLNRVPLVISLSRRYGP